MMCVYSIEPLLRAVSSSASSQDGGRRGTQSRGHVPEHRAVCTETTGAPASSLFFGSPSSSQLVCVYPTKDAKVCPGQFPHPKFMPSSRVHLLGVSTPAYCHRISASVWSPASSPGCESKRTGGIAVPLRMLLPILVFPACTRWTRRGRQKEENHPQAASALHFLAPCVTPMPRI